MNFNAILGLMTAILVVGGGIFTSTPNWRIFLDLHAFLIVGGGTLAATMVSFPLSQILKLIKVFWNKVIRRTAPPQIQVIKEIVSLAEGLNRDPNYLAENLQSIVNPFLREAVALQIEGGIPNSKIDTILKKRIDVHYVRYEDEATFFKTLSRFPPAFGLLGAVLGMVTLLSGLGSPDSFKTIGPSMAMAMVATMYGIALANFIFIPLGENLTKLTKEDHLMRSLIFDGLKLLRDKEHPLVVEEYLKSYLLQSERALMESNKEAA